MKNRATFGTWAIFCIFFFCADVCAAEMPLKISVLRVVNLYQEQLAEAHTTAVGDRIETAIDQVWDTIQPQGKSLAAISLPMPGAAFDQVARLIRENDLSSRYYEIRMTADRRDSAPSDGPPAKIAPPERNRTQIPMEPPSADTFSKGKTYMMTIGKPGYRSDNIDFWVANSDRGRPMLMFAKDWIYLEPGNYQRTGFIIETQNFLLAPNDENQLRERIGRELESRHHELIWLQQYRSMAEVLNCLRQRPPINPVAQMDIRASQIYCAEEKFNYLIRVASAAEEGSGTLKLDSTSRYLGHQQGKQWFRWKVFVDTSDASLGRIDSVTYYLHPTFNPNTVTVRNPTSAFALESSGWGTFQIRALVRFKDGNQTTLVHRLRFD